MSFQTRRIRGERPRAFPWKKTALFLMTVAGPLVRLHAYVSARNAKKEKTQENPDISMLRHGMTVSFALIIIILVILGSMKALAVMKNFSPMRLITAAAGTPLKTDKDGFTNILLLGVGDATHEGVDLTDSMMIVSLDTKTRSAVMLSLPRDLYLLKTDKMGTGRINSLYRDYKIALLRKGTDKTQVSLEALKQLASELGTLTNLDIPYVIKINFSGFEQAIDAIGGVDITVPTDLIDTEYPVGNDTYGTFAITAGPHHIDGATALKYVRSRHSTSDFSRSARQQAVIAAASEKLKANGLLGNVSSISKLMDILSKNFESTLSTSEIITLAGMQKKIDTSRIISMQLSDHNGLYGTLAGPGGLLYAPPREQFGGASVLLPVSTTGQIGNWSQIALLTDLLIHHRDWYLAKPGIAVLNATPKAGLASKLGNDLIRYGLNLVSLGNYDNKTEPASFLIENPDMPVAADQNQKKDPAMLEKEQAKDSLTAFFKTTLSMPTVRREDTLSRTDSPDIVIVLAKDYQYQNLPMLLEKTIENRL